MPFLPQDERGLQAALTLAEAAVGLASPNPTVGCVLVRDGVVLGQGAHQYELRDHAEIAALRAAAATGHDARGATAYVTLEPCAHHGRTGPCSEALVRAGIVRCVVATVDPNPLVCGEGFGKLRAGGVEVVVAEPSSLVAQSARRLNDAFAFAVQNSRPFVTLKSALSIDGKLAPPAAERHSGRPHWLTGPAARADVQSLRHASDAILTGIGTVLADNPSLTDRTGLPRRRPLLRVVLDFGLRIPVDSALLRSVAPNAVPDLLIVAAPEALNAREAALRHAGAEVIRVAYNSAGFDLRELMNELANRKINSLLLEGGAGVNGSFLHADLIDHVVLYYADVELGQDAVPFSTDGTSPYTLGERLTSQERRSFPNGSSEDVRISGYLHDPWAAQARQR